MEAYSGFAKVYDFLMRDVDYDSWVDYIEKIFGREGSRPKTILELACGTGNITNRLSKRGYDMIGIDISSEMLTFAKDKAHAIGQDVRYINQDMRDLNYSKQVDAIVCLCDGFNYILEEDDLASIFDKVYSLLQDEGIFIFDISSYYKLSKILGNNVYGENYEDVSYLWQNYFDDDSDICELDLTIFTRDGELFARHQECHYQRAYRREMVIELLQSVGFEDIDIYNAFTFEDFQYTDERICFVCKKSNS
ncbi:class I SAM-dependent methyltransferase [Wukongibacter baidiensis]|uniref:class I SAM-dependent DNA methyltransferase n=1 Tax=Wukongibacter baidiensis TaxID=1723361 RepID=UPI003D7FE7B3